ncbi:bifunctional folylpolyglutamate synthase/dihydrofolate synthase [Silvibacterium dinghuense]|uniref:Dihydrofolate synthase/folylpolyglutamate synthase n=1 Tax=Silvibacterium dinghuense TaxID=1560006 RepID=A0A4Q1SK64_9BACT|nr:folylpolyglutamate synthase/dihydrofolate synthase family protein [Silvibacterium dinghuense]RXS97845.1 bifunctional folylpolyglutamate synthase/dihydrofolate synthase [Silvibacterium dinghuense]GGH02406.1 bifunctional folylpolyglutamate synthase/dihydrofolate synthase [Silvibacterium dinghuense]
MSYAAAIEGLYALAGELHAPAPGQPRRKFELSQMRALAAALGNPQQAFPSVLVAGTNGKGSTSSTLASILAASGLRVGLYTSPHLTRVNERIQFLAPGHPPREIGDDAFARLYFQVDDMARRLVTAGSLPGHPSFFEAMTALAFLSFAEESVDIAVLEVGMGGRLDATNIVEPLVSVITDISLDHTEWLGLTITDIAREKAGILREHGVLVTLPQHPEANQAIGEIAVALHVEGINAADYIPSRATESNSYSIRVLGEAIEIASPLHGAHQQRNVALAITAATALRNRISDSYKLTPASIAAGIRNTRWPGRLEQIGRILFDVAHNPAGAWALRAALSHLDPEPRPLIAVFGCLRDKAIGEMTQILFPLFDRVILTEVPSPRTATLAELSTAMAATGTSFETAASPGEALERARALTGEAGLTVITGSVYLVGELRPMAQTLNTKPAR